MEVFVGLHVTLRSVAMCILSPDGDRIEELSLPCGVADIAAHLKLKGYSVKRIGFEAGMMSQMLFRSLTAEGFDVVCMEAWQVAAQLAAMRNKTDRNNARGIAQIVRTGWFQPVHMKSRQSHEIRTLLAARKVLLTKCIDLENEIRGLFKAFGIRLPAPLKRRHFDEAVRETIEGDEALSYALLPMLEARGILYRTFM